MSYSLTQADYKRLKTRLTYRSNRLSKAASRDLNSITKKERETIAYEAKQLVSEVAYATGIFEQKGYPDAWANWQRAKDDAESLIIRMQPGW
jgi:hypothetical protein